MATLDKTSPLAECRDECRRTACWEEEGDAAKARAFITACRHLIDRLYDSIQSSGGAQAHSLQLGIEKYERQLKEARAWLAANGEGKTAAGDSPPSVRHLYPSAGWS